jgi:predicted acylesterase/phospholipase RssA
MRSNDQLINLCEQFLHYFDDHNTLTGSSPTLFEAAKGLKTELELFFSSDEELTTLKRSIINEIQEIFAVEPYMFEQGPQYKVVGEVRTLLERLRGSGSKRFSLELFTDTDIAENLRKTAELAADESVSREHDQGAARPSDASPQVDGKHQASDKRDPFVLCLSGGGFRATLFHLGVINAIIAAGRLRDLSVLSGVSGGAITAAHLVKNWDQYDKSQQATLELVNYCRRGFRTRLILAWVACWPLRAVLCLFRRNFLSRGYFLSRAYRKLYGNFTIGQNATGVKLHLAATSITSGVPMSFGTGALHYLADAKHRQVPMAGLPFNLAVACSSAFPALFPPIRISAKTLAVVPQEWPVAQYLTDGGVHDNLGVETINDFETRTWDDASVPIFISNAGASSDMKPGARFSTILTRGPRTADLLTERARSLQAKMLTRPGDRLLWMQLANTQAGKTAGMAPEVVRMLREVRTDLNGFSSEEVDGLYALGYASCIVRP